MPDPMIFSASQKWELPILTYLQEIYTGKWLPSHDISHHQRVWKNAINLCESFGLENWQNDKSFFEKLIIACFFHDTGLLFDKGEFHGNASRKICEGFLSQHKAIIQFEVNELLEAIEYHDDKKYDSLPRNPNKLMMVLSLADDLDAFGAIGAYRYIEIYLLREIPQIEITQLILNNAENRYKNLEKILMKHLLNLDLYEQKYRLLKSFFDKTIYGEDAYTLISWINESIILPQKNPFTIYNKPISQCIEIKIINDFISKFGLEVKNDIAKS
jgi:HD superfamily phosphodiesterase